MDKESSFEPVVVDRWFRGVSLEVTGVPGDGVVVVYSPGGAPVLVPEKKLETMKTLVNVNIRRRRDSSFTKMTDLKSEKQYLDRYVGKLQGLVRKLDRPLSYEDIEPWDETNEKIDDSEMVHKIKQKAKDEKSKRRISRAYTKSNLNVESNKANKKKMEAKSKKLLTGSPEVSKTPERNKPPFLNKTFEKSFTSGQERENEEPIKNPTTKYLRNKELMLNKTKTKSKKSSKESIGVSIFREENETPVVKSYKISKKSRNASRKTENEKLITTPTTMSPSNEPSSDQTENKNSDYFNCCAVCLLCKELINKCSTQLIR